MAAVIPKPRPIMPQAPGLASVQPTSWALTELSELQLFGLCCPPGPLHMLFQVPRMCSLCPAARESSRGVWGSLPQSSTLRPTSQAVSTSLLAVAFPLHTILWPSLSTSGSPAKEGLGLGKVLFCDFLGLSRGDQT